MSEEKTHWKNNFNYDYLGSYSLAPTNKDVVLTISHVVANQEVKGENGKSDFCYVAYFKEADKWVKPMILNKTNCKVLEKLYTPYIEDWRNILIKVGISKIKVKGEEMDALRVRAIKPVVTKPNLLPDTEAWTNVVHHMTNEGVTLERIKNRYDIAQDVEQKLLEETKSDVS
jgi:hypothetical protein